MKINPIAIITQINGKVKAIILRHFQMNTIEKIKRLEGKIKGEKSTMGRLKSAVILKLDQNMLF